MDKDRMLEWESGVGVVGWEGEGGWGSSGCISTGRRNPRASVRPQCICNYSGVLSHPCPTPPLVRRSHHRILWHELPRCAEPRAGSSFPRCSVLSCPPCHLPFSSFNHPTGLLSACHPLFHSNSGMFATTNKDAHGSTFCGYCESPRKLYYSRRDALFQPREKSRALPGGSGHCWERL